MVVLVMATRLTGETGKIITTDEREDRGLGHTWEESAKARPRALAATVAAVWV